MSSPTTEPLASGAPAAVAATQLTLELPAPPATGETPLPMRLDYGPGCRAYFIARGATVAVLLAGGDKSTQDRDIAIARDLASNL
jgi:hypothetical protein